MSTKGKINVQVENIFPLIKKFLYSDHEIFLRELISNATDATTKLNHLVRINKANVEIGDTTIEVVIDKENKTIKISDKGLGMSKEEVEKYINEVAFSGAEEFLNKYKDSAKDTGIIGHFGLGFYSAFMVANKVEIHSKSYTESPAIHWTCDGSPEYQIEDCDKKERGTDITLHIADDSLEFLEEYRIKELLSKYNKFMPIAIKFGTKKEFLPLPEGADKDAKPEEIEVDNIINNPNPAWTKKPADLTDAEYNNFYREMYPMQFEEPLFNVHLNVDFPFNLTGILYFPKLNPNLQVQKDKIQLYQNQVFVTDNLEGIVPEFLTMLRGVIDSPDIPLNVSRSYLQADSNVKKISEYITKKVADKLSQLYKENKEDFEKKWNDIKIVIEYGTITDNKFAEKSKEFSLYQTVDNKYYTIGDFLEKIKDSHKDKDNKTIVLYTNDKETQHQFISSATEKNYEVLILDSPLTSHLIQKLEQDNENVSFCRVDSDHIDKIIKKEENTNSLLDDKQKESLKTLIEEIAPKSSYTVMIENMNTDSSPFIITTPEFMRRMKDMNQFGGNAMFGMGGFPDMYNLTVNANSALISKIVEEKDVEIQKSLISQCFNIAKLSQNLLKGEELTKFISQSYTNLIK